MRCERKGRPYGYARSPSIKASTPGQLHKAMEQIRTVQYVTCRKQATCRALQSRQAPCSLCADCRSHKHPVDIVAVSSCQAVNASVRVRVPMVHFYSGRTTTGQVFI